MRYEYLWKNQNLTCNAKNIDDFIEVFEDCLVQLKEWKSEGITLDSDTAIEYDEAIFVTDDIGVAQKWGFDEWDYLESLLDEDPEYIEWLDEQAELERMRLDTEEQYQDDWYYDGTNLLIE